MEDFNCYKNILGCQGQDEPNEAQRMEDTKQNYQMQFLVLVITILYIASVTGSN